MIVLYSLRRLLDAVALPVGGVLASMLMDGNGIRCTTLKCWLVSIPLKS